MANTKLNSIVRSLVVIMLLLVSAAITIRFGLRTDYALNHMKSRVEKGLSSLSGSEVHIESINGDAWNEITLNSICFDGDRVEGCIGELIIRYSFLENLGGNLYLSSALINEADLTFSNIEKENTGFTGGNGFVADSLSIRNSRLSYDDVYLSNAVAEASIIIEAETKTIDLYQFEANLDLPFYSETLLISSNGLLANESISIRDLIASDDGTRILSSIDAALDGSRINAEGEVPELSLNNFQWLGNWLPNEKSVNIKKLSLSGDFENFRLTLNGYSEEIQNFEVQSQFEKDEGYYLSGLSLNAGSFFEKDISVAFDSLELKMDGHLVPDDDQVDIMFEGFVQKFAKADYETDNIIVKGKINSSNVDIQADINIYPQSIKADVVIEDAWGNAQWNANLDLREVETNLFEDVSYLEGIINGKIDIEGIGYELSTEKWTYLAELENSYILDQIVDRAEIDGWIDSENSNFETKIFLGDSFLAGRFGTTVNEVIPSYSFEVAAVDFDLSDLTELQQTRSQLRANLSGSGQGIRKEEIELELMASLGQGTINTGSIEELIIPLRIKDQFVRIDSARLKSSFADGFISAYQNITNFSDPTNSTTFNLQVKDASPLASLFGLESLNLDGNLQGSVAQTSDGFSFLQSDFLFEDIEVNDQSTAESVSGDAEILFGQDNSFSFTIDVENPSFEAITFEDINFTSFGLIKVDSVLGGYNLQMDGGENGSLGQNGQFEILKNPKRFNIQVNRFNYNTVVNEYNLSEPFTIYAEPDYFKTDTLILEAEDNSYFWLSFENRAGLLDNCFFKTENFDLGIMQELLLQQKLVDGLLSGEFEVYSLNDDWQANAVFELADVSFEDSKIEKITLLFDVVDQRLLADFSARWRGNESLYGYIDVPYLRGDPEDFPNEFFREPVEGELVLQPTMINTFKSVLDYFDIVNTDGLASGNISLSGLAGDPDLYGSFKVEEPTLSGVGIDSLISDFSFSYETAEVDINASLYALKQEAAQLEASLPFNIDLRSLDLKVPSSEDEIYLKATTNELNLSVLEDFVSDRYLVDIGGTLKGDITFNGTLGNPIPNGEFSLTDASFLVPFTQMFAEKVQAKVRVDTNVVFIDEFSAESGAGSLTAAGQFGVSGLSPTSVDMDIKTEEFQLYNTINTRVWFTSNMVLSGSAETPELAGEATIVDGFYFTNELGERNLENIIIESDTLGYEFTNSAFYESLNVDMLINFEPDFALRNRDFLTIYIDKLNGSLTARKETFNELSLFGALNSSSGFARPLGKRFNLEEANITFEGEPGNPDLYTSFNFRPTQSRRRTEQQVAIDYIIEGPLKDPEYRLESEPLMDRRDIIGYVLFNRPYYRLDAVEQLLVSTNDNSTVDEESLDLLLSRVEQLATQQLGVDLVEVNTIRVGTERGTSIQTGWNINERTFFRIVNEIGAASPKTLFVLEYLINNHLDLIITQGNDRRQGVDLQWNYEY